MRNPGSGMASVLVIGTTRGVFALREDEAEWKLLGQGLPNRSIECLELGPDGIWAGTSGNGMARSSNLEEWQPLVNELSGRGVHAILFHPEQPGIGLYGTAPAGLHLGVNSGMSIQELPALKQHPGSSHWTYPSAPYRSRLHRLFLHPRDSNVIVVGILSGGVYLSADVGQSWHERVSGVGRHILDLHLHPAAPARLYATTPIGYFVSENLGEEWVECNSGLAYTYANSLALYPGEPDVAFLASHRTAQGGGGIYRTQNAGKRWEPCAGLPFQADLLYTSVIVSHNQLLVGTNRGDVYLSRDLGTTWGKIRAALPPITCMKLASAPAPKGA